MAPIGVFSLRWFCCSYAREEKQIDWNGFICDVDIHVICFGISGSVIDLPVFLQFFLTISRLKTKTTCHEIFRCILYCVCFHEKTTSKIMKKISSWEFSLKSSGHDVLKKLYFLRDIPGRQKKTVLFFKEILLFDGLLFFKRPSLEDSRNCTIYIYSYIIHIHISL